MSWLDALERALVLGRRKTVLVVSDAVVGGLRPLMRRLHDIDPQVVVTLRADELPELPSNSLVLLDTDAADLAWLNANRTFIGHQRLRLLLWWSGSTRAAREAAPDLLSWASEVLSCPQTPPPYAVRAFEALADHRPGSIWGRALLQACLDDRGRAAQWLASDLGFEGLVASLRALGDRVPAFTNVRTPAQRRVVTQALMKVDPPGPHVLVDAPPARGWCVVENPEGLAELVEGMPARVPVAARRRLASALDGEPQAAELAGELLVAGADADALFTTLLDADDPLEELCSRRGGAARPCRLQPSRVWPPLEPAIEPRERPTTRIEPLHFEPDMITWIHLSDIHAGQPGEAARPAVEQALERSITGLAERIGVPDLLLLTGDLAYSGKAEQYAQIEGLLARIEAWLGRKLPVFAVPGNHDLARPDNPRDKYFYAGLKHYEDEELVRENLWKQPPGFLQPLFAEYENWVERDMKPRAQRADHAIHWSARVPGDFSVVVQKGELRLGLVGLNSAWAQVDGGDYQGKLPLPAEQFYAALPGADQPLDWFKGVDAALLLTHHPRSWLSKRAREIYERDIHPPGRFDLALFGHMHEPESLLEGRQGTVARLFFQAPSLFGLEWYGRNEESRSFGYAWGRIRADGEIRVWPQMAADRAGGLALVDDPSFDWDRDREDGVLLREPRRAPVSVAVSQPPPRPSEVVEPELLDRYLEAIEGEHRSVKLLGFENRAGVLLKLDKIFVPVEAVIDRQISGKELLAGEDIAELRPGQETLSLARAFVRARQLDRRGLVLLGEPGAGKTTFLKQMLLQVARHGSGSVGLPNDVVPVFLPLRAIGDGETTLSDFVCAQLQDPIGDLGPDFGRKLCRRGKLLLLLDGLDEVADAKARERVARWIEQTRVYMPDSYMLVSCRYAGYTPEVSLKEDFLELHLRPLGGPQMRDFVRRWYAVIERELDTADPQRAAARAKAQADDLLEVLESPEFVAVARVHAMTRNPLLLTAICLVHRDHGRLPRTRGKLYRLCIDVLLARWRLGRDGMQLEPEQVLAVLQPVAAWMHRERGRARASYAELLGPVAEALARQRRVEVEAGEFLRQVRDDGGLLTGYSVDQYGFMHLGFQEFLTAQHLRNEYTAGRGGFRALARNFGDSWWQEVILLLLAERNPSVFEPFMAALVREEGFVEGWDSALMRQCWDEAAEPSAAPFLAFLREQDPALGERQLAAANLLARELPEALAELGEVLRDHATPALRGWWARREAAPKRVRGGEGVRVIEKAGVELVRIPAGSFMMGSPEGEEGRREREGPQHEVVLGEFYLARTPVTNAQYGRFMAACPDAPKPEYWADGRFNQPEQPVVGVSWGEAMAYCEWAGLVLPTEAQWEYACRAGTTSRYWSGDSEEDLARVGWYRENSGNRLHAVGEKDANPFGLYDMHGNVWEWCRDGWAHYDETKPRVGDGLRREPVAEGDRVIRGGSWSSTAHYARSAFRSRNLPGVRFNLLGFRPAQVIP
ncbi:MAG: SUMF1/EgtB/PvdO family nonheme iron enzyme [Enhygromyxa sp.]